MAWFARFYFGIFTLQIFKFWSRKHFFCAIPAKLSFREGLFWVPSGDTIGTLFAMLSTVVEGAMLLVCSGVDAKKKTRPVINQGTRAVGCDTPIYEVYWYPVRTYVLESCVLLPKS